jgi:hypothetical protein
VPGFDIFGNAGFFAPDIGLLAWVREVRKL